MPARQVRHQGCCLERFITVGCTDAYRSGSDAGAKLRALRTFTSGYEVPTTHVNFSIDPVGNQCPRHGRVLAVALRRYVIGGTAEGLLRNTPYDVLVVKASHAMAFH